MFFHKKSRNNRPSKRRLQIETCERREMFAADILAGGAAAPYEAIDDSEVQIVGYDLASGQEVQATSTTAASLESAGGTAPGQEGVVFGLEQLLGPGSGEGLDAETLESLLTSFSSERVEGEKAASYNESVHGSDDRTLVGNTTSFPFSSIVRLSSTIDGVSYLGTGAIIDEYHVLTAGHVIHDGSNWATSVTASAAQDGAEKFYGTANVTYMRSYTAWTSDQNTNHDWAVLTLDRSLGSYTGWMGRQTRSESDYDNGMILNTAGYPGDLGGTQMYFASGTTDHATSNKIYYSGNDGLDTAGGQSGSPLWAYIADGNERYINGVHTNGGSSLNSGARMTNDRFDDINTWIAEDDSTRAPNDRPDLVDYDDWFDTDFGWFTSSSLSPGDSFSASSFVRNNGTLAAGSFEVSFYASTNDYISSSDYLLGSVTVSSLSSFNWAEARIDTVLPDLPEGDYHVGYLIDSGGSQSEFLEGNNTGLYSGMLTVESEAMPDLTGAWLYTYDNGTAVPGQTVTLDYGYTNYGPGAADSIYDVGFYLSTDAYITTDDYLLTYIDGADLASGSYDYGSIDVLLPGTEYFPWRAQRTCTSA